MGYDMGLFHLFHFLVVYLAIILLCMLLITMVDGMTLDLYLGPEYYLVEVVKHSIMKKVLIFILKTIAFFSILIGMVLVILPTIPSCFYSSISGINMYNQKGIIKFLAKPYLYLHSLLYKLLNTTPYKGDFVKI